MQVVNCKTNVNLEFKDEGAVIVKLTIELPFSNEWVHFGDCDVKTIFVHRLTCHLET